VSRSGSLNLHHSKGTIKDFIGKMCGGGFIRDLIDITIMMKAVWPKGGIK
jgi:hypothetical protein